MATVAVIYKGPPAQQCELLAAHGHSATCEPGQTYELPEEAAERLIRTSAWFRRAPATKPEEGAGAEPKPKPRRRSRQTPEMAAEPNAEPSAEESK